MQVIIVGHHARTEWVAQLQRHLPGAAAIIDYSDGGSLQGHRSALEIAAQTGERCVILEDDAIPVIGFAEHAARWCAEHPHDLISFYLGTGRPAAWQPRVDRAVEYTDTGFITLPRLIHGVCYSIPADHVRRVLDRLHGGLDAADYAVGRAWGRSVVYPVESLVQHRDGASVEQHPDREPRTERRVARALAGPLMYPE